MTPSRLHLVRPRDPKSRAENDLPSDRARPERRPPADEAQNRPEPPPTWVILQHASSRWTILPEHSQAPPCRSGSPPREQTKHPTSRSAPKSSPDASSNSFSYEHEDFLSAGLLRHSSGLEAILVRRDARSTRGG